MTPFSPPSIADLTDRMLKARIAEPTDAAEPEVEPYEVLNGFRTDPRTAFVDAVAALKLLGVKDLPLALPPEWASYVQMMPATVAVPMAAGRFPQQVRDLAALLDGEAVHTPTPPSEASGFNSLRNWVKKQENGAAKLAAGMARSLGDEPAVPIVAEKRMTRPTFRTAASRRSAKECGPELRSVSRRTPRRNRCLRKLAAPD